MKVLFAPEVEEDLFELVDLLVRKQYLGTYDFAISYVEDLVADIQDNIHTKLKRNAPDFFNRYGRGLRYITYRRSSHTVWYIFFQTFSDTYLVTHISNNHVVGRLMS